MALTNQPYLPLYVNDWLSSTKLKMCSARAHGIMINTMLLMHKEEDYGYILLKQKFKQTDKQILNFASQFAKVLPFDLLEIETGLIELVDEGCLYLEGDLLKCKRMIKDADISSKRAINGSKGGKETMKTVVKKTESFAKAKSEANTEYEYIIVSVIEYLNKKASTEFKTKTKSTVSHISARLRDGFKVDDFKKVIDDKVGEWKDDSKMSQYLRPETLFGNKFEGYLQASKAANSTQTELQPNSDDFEKILELSGEGRQPKPYSR